MSEEEIAENAEAGLPAGDAADDSADAQINDTDIVFDCPHCGHKLCID